MTYLDSLYQYLLTLARYLTPQMSLVPILFLLLFWCALCLLTSSSLKRARRSIYTQMQRFNPLYLDETLPSGNDILGQLVREYRKALLGRGGVPDTEAMIAIKIAPIGSTPERLARWSASTSIGLGLLGTFLGLVNAINAISTNLRNLGGDIDPSNLVATVSATLNEPLSGMGVAFISSIAGLIVSFFMSFMMAWFDFPEQRAKLADHIAHFLNNRLFPAVHTDPLQKIVNQLGERIGSDFERSLATLGAQMTEMSEQMIATMKGLNSLVTQLRTASEALDGGSKRMLEFNKGLASSLDHIDKSTNRVVESTEHLAVGVGKFEGLLSTLKAQEGERLAQLEAFWGAQEVSLGKVSEKLLDLLADYPQHLEHMISKALSDNRALLEKLLAEQGDKYSEAGKRFGESVTALEDHLSSTFDVLQELQRSQKAVGELLQSTQQSAKELAESSSTLQYEMRQVVENWAGRTLRTLNRGLDDFARKIDLMQQLSTPYEEKLEELRESMVELKSAYVQNIPLALAIHFEDLKTLKETLAEAERGFKQYGEQVAATVSIFNAGIRELAAGIKELSSTSEVLSAVAASREQVDTEESEL